MAFQRTESGSLLVSDKSLKLVPILMTVGSLIVGAISGITAANIKLSQKADAYDVNLRFMRDSLRHEIENKSVASEIRILSETIRDWKTETNTRLREICEGVRRGCR